MKRNLLALFSLLFVTFGLNVFTSHAQSISKDITTEKLWLKPNK